MKKLIALVMTLVLAVSMAAMASAANTQDTHAHDCPDCAAVSVQTRAGTPHCTNSVCGYAPLTKLGEHNGNCLQCGAAMDEYKCYPCQRLYLYCDNGHLVRWF